MFKLSQPSRSRNLYIQNMFKKLSSKNNHNFILHLYSLLQEGSPLLMWVNSGSSFVITDHLSFEEQILPKYFMMRKFVSFTRKLTKYGFSRCKKGENIFIFHHKNFSSDGKKLEEIQKLTRQELVPKHLKLKMLREEFNQKIDNQIRLQRECELTKQSETNRSEKNTYEEDEQRQAMYQALLKELFLNYQN